MTPASLDIQQARIKHILFKSQLRSVLYGVREADEALFSPQGNALGQWLSTEVKLRYPGHPAVREAERLFQQLLSTGRELAAQYRQGHIDEARRGLTRIDQVGEELVAALQLLGTH